MNQPTDRQQKGKQMQDSKTGTDMQINETMAIF